MTTFTSDIQDRSVETTVDNSTFRPQLFLVPIGSYASNYVYGSGAAPIQVSGNDATYDPVTIRSSTSSLKVTKGEIRVQDKGFDFDITITLDTTLPDPFPIQQELNGELRIRTKPLIAGEPGRYLNKISIASQKLPLFNDVEILLDTVVLGSGGTNALPNTAFGELQARWLHGCEIALITKNLAQTLGPPTVAALTAADLSPFFNPLNSDLRIILRGTYLTEANPTGF